MKDFAHDKIMFGFVSNISFHDESFRYVRMHFINTRIKNLIILTVPILH